MKKLVLAAVFVLAMSSIGWAHPEGHSDNHYRKGRQRYHQKNHRCGSWCKIKKQARNRYRNNKYCKVCSKRMKKFHKRCARKRQQVSRRRHRRHYDGGYVKIGRSNDYGYFRVIFGQKF